MSSNEQFAAAVELAAYNFFKVHFRKDNLSSCIANRAVLEEYMDENLLDASKAESWELAYLAKGSTLARTSTPVAPTPPAPVAVEASPQQLSEQDELRQILREHPGDPKATANAMRARLKVAEVRSKIEQTTLPADVTKEVLIRDRFLLRRMVQRYGTDVVNDRLNGRN